MESQLITTDQLVQLTSISKLVDVELLQPHLLIAQQLFVQPVLGDPLYNDIVSRYDNNSLTGDTLVLYDDYIVPAIAYSAWYNASTFIAYKTTPSGIQTQGSPDTTATTPEEFATYRSNVGNLKDFYLKRLNDYLIADNGVMFPLFRDGNTPVESTKGGGLYLGFKRNIVEDLW